MKDDRLRKNIFLQKKLSLNRCVLAPTMLLAVFVFSAAFCMAAESGAPIPPERFSDDFYKVYGTPNLTVSLEQNRVYQGEKTSIFLTLTNRGRINAFQVNEEPGANKREEILAAQNEQELEKQRTIAQDVSILLLAENDSAIDIKRAVAFPGNIREGQTSARLEFPIEAYKNTKPGQYRLDAIANYTYQKDVAVKGDEDHPESPDVFYWYDILSQTIPLTLTVERRSDVQFEILNVSPAALLAGAKDNVIRVRIKNVGHDTAKYLVARLRPESGLYVSVDESPIAALPPQQEAELIFKLDVSKDAVPGKSYQAKVVFEFSDSYRDDLTDEENAYLRIEPQSSSRLWEFILLFIVLAAVLIVVVIRRRGKS
jgi:hypothetical protein